MDVVNVEIANLDDLKKRFVEICATINRPGMEDLMAWLERSDFYTAPASTRFHGNYTGGLLEHRTGHIHRKRCGWLCVICSRQSAAAPHPLPPGHLWSQRKWFHRAGVFLLGYCFFFSSYSTIRFFNSSNRIFRSFCILDLESPRSEAISRSLS